RLSAGQHHGVRRTRRGTVGPGGDERDDLLPRLALSVLRSWLARLRALRVDATRRSPAAREHRRGLRGRPAPAVAHSYLPGSLRERWIRRGDRGAVLRHQARRRPEGADLALCQTVVVVTPASAL